jgi:ABC-type lipoprotein release transport system permease subunit
MMEGLKFFCGIFFDLDDPKAFRRGVMKFITGVLLVLAVMFLIVVCSISGTSVAELETRCMANGKQVTEVYDSDGKLLKIICHPKSTDLVIEQ